MKPPYQITREILEYIVSISEKLGEVKGANLIKAPTEIRKRNRIKTIQSSLEIEGNNLTVEQITAILNNKRVIAPEKDILEVKNAINVYDDLDKFDVYSLDSLCDAHEILMQGLIPSPGRIRNTSVGIAKGNQLTHIAPPGDIVFALMKDLFDYLKNDDDLLLIKSCVFHYEFEFIHPFVDGNGRMGRLWQTLILKEYNEVFEYLPIESMIKSRQQEYYQALGMSDNKGDSTVFIEYMLKIINDSLEEVLHSQNISLTWNDRIEIFQKVIGTESFCRADYLRNFKNISNATASRDLRFATENEQLIKTGNGRNTVYKFR